MEAPRRPAIMDIIALNGVILGRTDGLIDEGKLTGGLARAEMAAYYEGADFAAQAAYLIAGVALAQAFIDGNKRTAYATAALFLAINGLTLPPDNFSELARMTEALVLDHDRDSAIDRLASWFRGKAMPRARDRESNAR